MGKALFLLNLRPYLTLNPNSNSGQVRLRTFSCFGHCCTKEMANCPGNPIVEQKGRLKNHKSLSTPLSLADLTLAEVFLRVLVWSMRSIHVQPHHSMDDLYTQLPSLLIGKVYIIYLRHTQIKAVYSTASLPRAEDNIHLWAQE